MANVSFLHFITALFFFGAGLLLFILHESLSDVLLSIICLVESAYIYREYLL